jgi:serine acetyltransferase
MRSIDGGAHTLLRHRISRALHEAGVLIAPRLMASATTVMTGIKIHRPRSSAGCS